MEYRRLGSSGLQLSALSFGAWVTFGNRVGRSEARNLIALAYDITAYDACYVALAQQLDAPLITADETLVRKLVGTAYDMRWLGNFPVPPLPIETLPSSP